MRDLEQGHGHYMLHLGHGRSKASLEGAEGARPRRHLQVHATVSELRETHVVLQVLEISPIHRHLSRHQPRQRPPPVMPQAEAKASAIVELGSPDLAPSWACTAVAALEELINEFVPCGETRDLFVPPMLAPNPSCVLLFVKITDLLLELPHGCDGPSHLLSLLATPAAAARLLLAASAARAAMARSTSREERRGAHFQLEIQ
ncbi:hypothetical protein VPH35_035999 [Triticum aestivum]